MNRFLAHFGLVGLFVLWAVCPSRGQGAPPATTTTPTTTTTQPATGGNRGSAQQEQQQNQNRDQQLPLYVEGRVLAETGQPVPDLVSLKLTCGMRTLQVIKTDLQGYFRFAMGAGTQANTDFSAADEAPESSILSGVNVPGGYTGFGTAGNSLTGCDVRMSVPGYQPFMMPITESASLGTIDIGILELRRTTKVTGTSVSATSLMVPNNARKEFDQGVKDLQSNRLSQGTQHLEKAVGAYDKYAAAWTELGKAYGADHQMDKARQAYEKAIAADPKYAPPYVSLAGLKLENQDYEGALETIGKAVDLDPAITMGVAGYMKAIAEYRLDRLDAAQESLLQAEKGPHQNIPQLHAMLADIYLRNYDSPSAAAQMRAYLKEAPQGAFAAELRKNLEIIDKAMANNAGGSGAPPPIAP